MAVKKVAPKKVRALPKHLAPLSQRPNVTLAILAVLVCLLALTVKMIQWSGMLH